MRTGWAAPCGAAGRCTSWARAPTRSWKRPPPPPPPPHRRRDGGIDRGTMSEPIDALFIPYYVNVDRWHNDDSAELPVPSVARTRATLDALSDAEWMKDEVDLLVEGKLYDFSRFLSWVRYGTTREWSRYDPFSMT